MSKYQIVLFWSDDDAAFIAKVPDLPGCVAQGSTADAALANCQDAIDLWIDPAKEFGRRKDPFDGLIGAFDVDPAEVDDVLYGR